MLLSFYLIPNIITVILPFILIFTFLLCFIKLNKDNEFVALYYYIDSNSYTSNLFDPPYITYELIILVKNNAVIRLN